MRDFQLFSKIVCSESGVTVAFSKMPGFRQWWQIILWLHGKPTNPNLSQTERLITLSDGFRFYATLYRVLGVFLVAFAPLLLLGSDYQPIGRATYWASTVAMMGVYLWLSSAVGYHGANKLKASNGKHVSTLIVFMVLIIAFLSSFVAVLSVIAELIAQSNIAVNMIALVVLFVFGIGSYLIEILYLATDGRVLT